MIRPASACDQQRFGLHRQLQLEAQQAEHVGDDRARRSASRSSLQIACRNAWQPKCSGRHQAQQLEIEIEAGADPFARRALAALETRRARERQQDQQQQRHAPAAAASRWLNAEWIDDGERPARARTRAHAIVRGCGRPAFSPRIAKIAVVAPCSIAVPRPRTSHSASDASRQFRAGSRCSRRARSRCRRRSPARPRRPGSRPAAARSAATR